MTVVPSDATLSQYGFEAIGDDRAVDASRDFARWLHEHPDEWTLVDNAAG